MVAPFALRSRFVGLSLWACLPLGLPAVAAAFAGSAFAEPQDRNETTPSTRQKTAEELLRELRRARPQTEAILPASADSRPMPEPEKPLWPEGYVLVDRRGRLEHREGWWNLVFEPPTADLPVKLLPNAILEALVATVGEAPSSLSFVVSGEWTVHHGENYALLRDARRIEHSDRPTPAAAHSDAAGGGETPKSASDEPDNSDTVPYGSASASLPHLEDAAVGDVLAALQDQQPEEAMIPLPSSPNYRSLSAGNRLGAAPLRDGAPLVRRAGRVVKDGSWWRFVFESDHPEHPEPPLKLLPNRNAELMIAEAENDNAGLVYIVSGELTAFQGENFLLVRGATRRADASALSK